MNPITEARLQIIGAAVQISKIGHWLNTYGETLPMPVLLLIGAMVQQIASYARTTLHILDHPNEDRSTRCMFY